MKEKRITVAVAPETREMLLEAQKVAPRTRTYNQVASVDVAVKFLYAEWKKAQRNERNEKE